MDHRSSFNLEPFPRPRVLVSRCLEFDAVRYNGERIPDQIIRELMPHVEFVPVCPEVEVGMGVPRKPVRLVQVEHKIRMLQPETGQDWTEPMRAFAEGFLEALGPIDGFILKSRSPSCGLRDVRVYPASSGAPASQKSTGLFAQAVLEHFPDYPIEEEGRLTNLRIREHFLMRIFASALWRQYRARGRMRDIVAFHTQYKLLLLYYNQSALIRLGRLVANSEGLAPEVLFARYEREFRRALERLPRLGHAENVLLHAFGYVSEKLERAERAYFLEVLRRFRNRQLPLSVPLALLRSWVLRFDEPYLKTQRFFEPYAAELVMLYDSDKGRTCS
ncbi:MAG: DUF523 and DUF1722 domain-containing protein [Candidatus Kapabacteria bacterium]|nr:DUF523 and DUF1722 domain-containing protein [Candidatus Kapabacteria bacterium]